MRLVVEASTSRLVVRTRATGLLARLAHDLEIVSRGLRGSASIEGESWSAELTVPVASLHVAGTLRGDALDSSALSAGDRAEIERRLRIDVLAVREIVANACGSSPGRGEVVVSRGSASASATTTLVTDGHAAAFRRSDAGEAHREPAGRVSARGRAELSLRALGIPEVKGPLGAFKLRDEVLVLYELELVPEATPP